MESPERDAVSSPVPELLATQLYGELRGLNAPPRSIAAPAPATAAAIDWSWSADSTAHGPAITTKRSSPSRSDPATGTSRRGAELDSDELNSLLRRGKGGRTIGRRPEAVNFF